jgi:hypothetical protein
MVLIGGGALLAGLWQPADDASAASLTVVAYLYHPANDAVNTAHLSCGWHWNCDGVFPDSDPRGLDWRPCAGPINAPCPNQSTWIRLKAYTTTGSGWVAQAQSKNAPFWGGEGNCPAIATTIRRVSDNGVVAVVWNLHSKAPPGVTYYLNIYASPSGVQNSGGIGSFINHVDDPCSTFWHTMQLYSHGPAGSSWLRNTYGIPQTEANCRPWTTPYCDVPYRIWTTYEHALSFTS